MDMVAWKRVQPDEYFHINLRQDLNPMLIMRIQKLD